MNLWRLYVYGRTRSAMSQFFCSKGITQNSWRYEKN